jgi:hypothetical protein
MRKKSKKPQIKRKKPEGVEKKTAKPAKSKKKDTPATRKLKPSPALAARTAFATTPAGTLTETIIEAGCLPYPQAQALVYRCGSPEADGVPSSTPLGNLFGGARLTGFCQCVATGVPCAGSKVPCAAGKTLQDVIDAIACK